MLNNTKRGKYGEEIAAFILQQWDFNIMETNWRYAGFEIDLIASHGKVLHFIEVKLRTGIAFGFPEESVDDKKMSHLQEAAEAYLSVHHQWKFICFDIMSILLKDNGYEYRFIEDIS